MTDAQITPDDLRGVIGQQPPAATAPGAGVDLPLDMGEVEKWALKRGLEAAEGKKMVAARLLGMNYYTFRRRLAKYGMDNDTED